jgi:hypothetical protein
MLQRQLTSGGAPTTTKIMASAAGAVRATQPHAGEAAVRTECRDAQRVGSVRSRGQSGGFSATSGTGVRISTIVFIGVLQCARSCATFDFVDRDNAEGAVDAINKSAGDAFDNRPNRHRICAQIAQRHEAAQCTVWRIRTRFENAASAMAWAGGHRRRPAVRPDPDMPSTRVFVTVGKPARVALMNSKTRAAPRQFTARTGLPLERGRRAPDEVTCRRDVIRSVHCVPGTVRGVRIEARLRVRQVPLKNVRIHGIDERVPSALRDQRGLGLAHISDRRAGD